jgi:hypothetical protein
VSTEAAVTGARFQSRVSSGTPGHTAASSRFVAASAALAAAGAIGLSVMTRWGIGTSPDSAGYLVAARSLAASGGAVLFREGLPGAVALTHYAPLYSLLLSAGGLFGVDPYDFTRWLNAALFAANVLLTSAMLRHVLGGAGWLWIAGVVWTMASVPILTLHVTMLSEPLFLLLTFLGLWQLAKYLETANRSSLVVAALAVGLAWLTRYAGVVTVAVGGLAVLTLGGGRLTRRIQDAIVFGVISSAGMLAWMVRNAVVSYSATGREFAVHPIERSHVWQLFYTMSSWLMIPDSGPDWLRFAAWSALGAAGAAALVAMRRETGTPPPLVSLVAGFAAAYLAFLAVSISFFDAATPLDDRILSPVYVAGVVVTLWWARELRPVVARRPALARLLAAVLIVFTGAVLAQAARLGAASYSNGWGFSSTSWQGSPTIQRLKQLPETVLVYSNAPEIVYLQTGRAAHALPRQWSAMNQRPNPDYPTERAALERTLSREPAVVAYFNGLRGEAAPGGAQTLAADLQLRVRDRTTDGLILCAAVCPE